MDCHSDLAKGGVVLAEASWTVGQGFRQASSLTSISDMCKTCLFYSFEEPWSKILSHKRHNLILSLEVLIINIVIVLEIIVLTFKRAARFWAGHCHNFIFQ